MAKKINTKQEKIKQIQPPKTIWDDIKDKSFDFFGTPNQFVRDYVTVKVNQKDKLILSAKIQGIIPILDTVLSTITDLVEEKGRKTTCPRYQLEQAETYCIIKPYKPAENQAQPMPNSFTIVK